VITIEFRGRKLALFSMPGLGLLICRFLYLVCIEIPFAALGILAAVGAIICVVIWKLVVTIIRDVLKIHG
jgi:hypothetical protein